LVVFASTSEIDVMITIFGPWSHSRGDKHQTANLKGAFTLYVASCRPRQATTDRIALKNIFVANAFISTFNTQTMLIRSFYTQQHCYVSLKTLHSPWRDSNPGLLVPEADAMSTAPCRRGTDRIASNFCHATSRDTERH
jgi:hypothetical protein